MEPNRTATALPLSAYVLLVWDGRRTIAAAAIVCGLLALATVFVAPSVYEAELTVLVLPPTFKEEIPPNTAVNGYNPRTLATLMPPRFAVETYQALAQSPSLLLDVSNALDLDPASFPDLVARCNVRLVQLGSRTPQFGTTYADALVFSMRDKDPESAAHFVEQWTALYIERIDKLNGDVTDRTAKLVDTMYAAAKEKLTAAEKQYEAFKKQWNLALLEAEKAGYEKLISDLEADLEQTELAIVTTSTLLDKTREQLAGKERIESLFQAPSADAYWITKKAAEGGPRAKPITPDDGLRTEVRNPEYLEIKTEESGAEQRFSQSNAKKNELATRIEAVRQRVQKVNEDLATQRLVETALEREVKTHEESYQLAAKSKDMSEFAIANRESDLHIFGDAVAPALPVSIPKSYRVVLGCVLGALLGAAYVLVRHALKQIAPAAT